MPNKELKIVVLRKLSELLENRKTIQQNRENNTSTKMRSIIETEIIKKNQTKILELKRKINKIKNAIESIKSPRIKQKKESIK